MTDPPRKRMRRRDVPGTARFLTFSWFQRLRLFDNDRIKDRFVERFIEAVARHDVAVLARVVMPEHVHLIVYAEDARPLGPFLQTLKDPFAREVLARWRSLDAPVLPRLREPKGSAHFWQAGGGYDRNVIGPELMEKIRYIHRNPIASGLSPDSVSWKWSSAATYREREGAVGPPITFGLIPNHHGELT